MTMCNWIGANYDGLFLTGSQIPPPDPLSRGELCPSFLSHLLKSYFQRLSMYSAAPQGARASSPALAASPTAASPAPAPAPPTPTGMAAFGPERTVPFFEGTFQITSMNGNPMGYLSRVMDADATYPRTNSRYSALRVSFPLLADKHAIKLLVSVINFILVLSV